MFRVPQAGRTGEGATPVMGTYTNQANQNQNFPDVSEKKIMCASSLRVKAYKIC